jgi:hypothetical protein
VSKGLQPEFVGRLFWRILDFVDEDRRIGSASSTKPASSSCAWRTERHEIRTDDRDLSAFLGLPSREGNGR